MELRLDLHIHSEASPDGCMKLAEIVQVAKQAGLHGVAICDHDCTAVNLPETDSLLLIPGVEISTEYGHLLGLFLHSPVETRDFREAVAAIHEQGGLAVLAHPFERTLDAARLTPILPLVDGIEVWNSRASRKNPRANEMAAELAQKYGLRSFAGSDAHVPQEIGHGVVTVCAEACTAEAVKAALLHGTVNISGCRSKARYVARSQLTKRKKTHAPLRAYLKWALFAAKCCLQDLIQKGV